MKRDLDLIRQILLEVEKKEKPIGWIDIQVKGYSNEQVAYHVKLLAVEGYMNAKDLSTKTEFDYKPIRLTLRGHDFLNAARDDTVWNQVKETVGNKIVSTSLEVLKSILISFSKGDIRLFSE